MNSNRSIVKAGFTLVELAVVIVIIGVLAAFAVPRFRAAVERSKAAESFNYLSSVQAAQECYHARQGVYASAPSMLDITFNTPKYFTVGTIPETGTALESSWSLQLTRAGAAAGYGPYTVTFTEDGFDPNSDASSIVLKTDINPMAISG